MRVSTNMLFNNAQVTIQKQMARLQQTQEEAASGKRVRRPSDDVTDTRRILSSRGTLEALSQFKRNRGTLDMLLGTTDRALQDVGNVLNRAKELAVQGANDTLSRNNRSFIADEVAQLYAQTVQTGNTQVEGRHLFAGRRTDQRPFEALFATENTGSGLTTSGTLTTITNGDLSLNGVAIRAPLAADDTQSTSDNAASALALAAVINEAAPTSEVQADAFTTLSLTAAAFGNLSAGEFTINGQDVVGTITDAASLVAAVNAANIPGVLATSAGPNDLTLFAADGRNLQVQTTGGVAGMNFTEFDLSGGALDQTTTGTVRLFSDAAFTIGGADPTRAGLNTGDIDRTVGGRFQGDTGTVFLQPGAAQNLKASAGGAEFLTTVVEPRLDVSTPLSSLRQGQGITPGSIQLTDRAGGSATIDLSTATTVGDVLTAISTAAGINVTATINSAGNGITVTDTTATVIQHLTIQEVGTGTSASELGLLADRPGPIEGTPLEPNLTLSTPVSLLTNGQVVPLGTLHVANGALEADVDLSSAQTIADVLALINGSGTNVAARIALGGRALDVRSTDPTSVAIVTDVDNRTAKALGIQGPNDILKTLGLLHDALQRNDQAGIDGVLQHLDSGLEQVATLRADVGARMNRVELVDARQDELELTVTRLLSDAEDTDPFEVFSRLTNLSTALQAALAATARTAQLSLLDFLR